jgi:hypothetical protein
MTSTTDHVTEGGNSTAQSPPDDRVPDDTMYGAREMEASFEEIER